MIKNIDSLNMAILGGGDRCKAILQAITGARVNQAVPDILGVADPDSNSIGISFAREQGIFTTAAYEDLFAIKELDLIIDLTRKSGLAGIVKAQKPPWILFLDAYGAREIMDYLQIKARKAEILEKIRKTDGGLQQIEPLFEEFYDYIQKTNRDRDTYFTEIRENLVSNEWALSQIVQGSTIPTFVIDKDHRVTHWNRACEVLTGYKAASVIGTDHQWKPFRSEKRPTMADLILDGVKEEDLWLYYGSKWEKSGMIEGGYEAEEFFSQLGQNGKWIFFTAVPIKAPDGSIAGAIETLWDKSREKEAEAERERQNKELALKVNELTANQQAMTQIIQGSTIPTFVIDRDHRVTHWNKALEGLTGFSAQQIVGTSRQWAPFYEQERPSMADVVLDQIDESEIAKLYGAKWRKSVLIEDAYEAEIFFPNLGDSGKWCWFTAAPIKTPDGELVGAIETIWDKTEDRKAEKEREQHTRELATFCSIYATLSGSLTLEGRIKAAIQEAANIFLADGICIFILQDDGKYHLIYNHGYSDMLCYENRVAGDASQVVEVANRGTIAVIEDLPDSEEDEICLLKKEGLRSLVYIPIADKEKTTFGIIRVASRIRGHFDADAVRALELIGNRIGVAIENSMLQEDIRRKADFQALLIGSSHDGIIATDHAGKIVTFNPAAEKIFGYSAKEIIGQKNTRDIFPSSIIENFDSLLSATGGDTDLPWQESFIDSKGEGTIPVMFSGTLLHEKNQVIGSVAFFHDLREIKRLEKELVSAERLAAIGQTVAGMAHCIKNILHGLKGGSYLVNIGINKDNTEKLKSGWDMVQRNIGRTSDLVQDLLSYSKEREPEPQACFPNEIAEDVCELMQEVAAENNVAITRAFSQRIGEVVLDSRTLHRTLLNLVSNAIDACRFDDSVDKTHCVHVATELAEENTIRFEVSDNGSGMDAAVKEKLFASFFSTKGPQGTGLGLLVTKKLIEENSGTINFESEAGTGTTFIVHLPFESV